LPAFMWRNHVQKLKIAFPSEVLVSSDYRPYRNLAFYNVLARQCSSFYNRARLNFQAFALRDKNGSPRRLSSGSKKWVTALVLANWTILALDEIIISTCRISRVIRLRFNSTTQKQMSLLLYGGHICVPPRGTNMASPYKGVKAL